jgi:hypothetical protein
VDARDPSTWNRWTAWDARLFARAAASALAALLLAWLVTAATDEGGVPWGERAGRTLPLAPLCAAFGVAIALAPARWRGELAALAGLGRSRIEVSLAAIAGGAAVALCAGLLLALPRAVDVGGFYPTATHGSSWAWTGNAFVDAAHGLRVAADGAPRRVAIEPAAVLAALPPHARGAAALTTALAGLALSLLMAHGLLAKAPEVPFARRDAWPIAWAAASLAASVVLFQAAAAHRAPAMAAALPALALLAAAAQRYRASP